MQSYNVRLKVTDPDSLSFTQADTEFDVISTPLVVFIEGGNRMNAFEKTTIIAGICKDPDLPPINASSNIIFNWKCKNLNTGLNCTNIALEPIDLPN